MTTLAGEDFRAFSSTSIPLNRNKSETNQNGTRDNVLTHSPLSVFLGLAEIPKDYSLPNTMSETHV